MVTSQARGCSTPLRGHGRGDISNHLLQSPKADVKDNLRAERDRALAELQESLEQISLLKMELEVCNQVIRDMLDNDLCRSCYGQRFGAW